MRRCELTKLPGNVQARIAAFLPFRVVFAPHLLADYLESFPLNHAKLEFVYCPPINASLADCEHMYVGILEDFRARVKEIKIVGFYWCWRRLITFALERRIACLTLRVTISSPIDLSEFVKQCGKTENVMHRFSLGFKNMEASEIRKHLRDLVRQDTKLVALTISHIYVGYEIVLPLQSLLPSLVCLQLCHVRDFGASDLDTLMRTHRELIRLEVVGALSGDELARVVASQMLTGHKLKHLCFTNTRMTDIGAVALGSALTSANALLTCHLDELLGDPSAFSFAEVLLLNSTIIALKFENCKFSTGAASSLVDVLQSGNTTLQTLTFNKCGYGFKDAMCSYTWMGKLRCSRSKENVSWSSCSQCKWPYYTPCFADGTWCIDTPSAKNGLHVKFRQMIPPRTGRQSTRLS